MKTLVLLHSLGADAGLWEPQRAALGAHFRLVTPEVRAPPASIAAIGEAVLEQLDERAHVLGLSMGGLVGLWLALHGGARIDRLVLACTGARIGTPAHWEQRIADVRAHGLPWLAEGSPARWFKPGFADAAAIAAARARMLRAGPEVYLACSAAIRDFDVRAELGKIAARTLVIVGTHDLAAPPENGRFLAEHIPDARLVELDAAHLANVEAADAFNAAVLEFLGDDHG